MNIYVNMLIVDTASNSNKEAEENHEGDNEILGEYTVNYLKQ